MRLKTAAGSKQIKKACFLVLLCCFILGTVSPAADAVWFNEIPFASEGIIKEPDVRLLLEPNDTAYVKRALKEGEAVRAVYNLIGSDYAGIILESGERGFAAKDSLLINEKESSGLGESLYDMPENGYEYEYRCFMEGYDGYVCGDYVQFRNGPSIGSESIAEFMRFTPLVTMTDPSKSWVGVIINGCFGYIHKSYIACVTDADRETYNLGTEVALEAMKYVGTPYISGSTDPSVGFDCGTFVQYVYAKFGYNIHSMAESLMYDGVYADPERLFPGDIICFFCKPGEDDAIENEAAAESGDIYSSDDRSHHVGIYLGGGKFIRATKTGDCIRISTFAQYNKLMGYDVPFSARRIVSTAEKSG